MKDLVDLFKSESIIDDVWMNNEDYDEDGMEGLTLLDEDDFIDGCLEE